MQEPNNFERSLGIWSSKPLLSHLEIPLSTLNECSSVERSEETVAELLSPSKDMFVKEPLSPNFVDSVNKGFYKNLPKKRPKINSESQENVCVGLWTKEEHQRFLTFWRSHEMRASSTITGGLELASKKIRKRRKKRYFIEMAEFIQTRDSVQCRSHEQKYSTYLKRVAKNQSPKKTFKTLADSEDFGPQDNLKSKANRKDLQFDIMISGSFDGLSPKNETDGTLNETEANKINLRAQMYDSPSEIPNEFGGRFNQGWDFQVSNLQYSSLGENSSPKYPLSNFENYRWPLVNSVPQYFRPENRFNLVEDLILNCEQFNLIASQNTLSANSVTGTWQ